MLKLNKKWLLLFVFPKALNQFRMPLVVFRDTSFCIDLLYLDIVYLIKFVEIKN